VEIPTVTAPTIAQAPSTTTAARPPEAKQEGVAPVDTGSTPRASCPPSLSKQDCRALVQAIEEARDGTPSGASQRPSCPPSLSKSDCQALAQAIEQGGSGSGSNPVCPPSFSKSDCQALAEAIERARP
jgi:hypothetical protein